ncbi:TIGR00730 family Rossman fold protein [Pasteurella skyensis]|uniref:Cytokinin riboside 5'-monophosphate phosphoribohydrolase n=1 Tax=Phocoenobacter skyensis TaxID=97481 RepID=A0AAJ6P0S4_9PAST|nr:TIGR00730 family Rossman fold protein [Pasteurella skyensis]MDP8162909.1 TIGR00730 family Rossman fold protein [Pasteurella skyensis]MDP8172939.1 TIGR00730 family Rossman fold protein [Pasteurella skyensis]MDP8176614.1 TIGR00730 family Rossman fold protein [Pasteurella skyensis]MDP8179439.1 TIGR00730 family Rossman fold protein [Pasteurella skyensis]MDP8183519.1 TIGR00730 family Rossman fold protein [Pasteurella skyensis]
MNITVYCGANFGNHNIYKEKTYQLGKWIATNGHTLIYGGGNRGLMGAIANSVLELGGKVIGVMPTFLAERELAHKGLSEMILVETMTERKLKMIELGDCYIALPGGAGTLEEIAEVVSWARIGQNNNPCLFLNIEGYYDNLRNFYNDMVNNGFLGRDDEDKILFTDCFDEMSNFIQSYEPPKFRTYK